MRKALGLTMTLALAGAAEGQESDSTETPVTLESDGWRLACGFRLPAATEDRVPAVVLLHGAARNRAAYAELASHLATRGIASLRLDLRAHGESTNRGRFVPGEEGALALLDGTPRDVVAAHRYLESLDRIDASRIAFVGASYSGEATAEAGRLHRKGRAYVALSPGSLSDESIAQTRFMSVSPSVDRNSQIACSFRGRIWNMFLSERHFDRNLRMATPRRSLYPGTCSRPR